MPGMVLIIVAVVVVIAAVGAGVFFVTSNNHPITTSIPGVTTTIISGTFNATQSQLPIFVSGEDGSAKLFTSIAGHASSYSCTLAVGSTLPSGLTLERDCVIDGIHTLSPGTTKEISPPFSVTLARTNSTESANFTFSITIEETGPTLIQVQGQCTEGVYCNTQVAAAFGGTPPYYFVSDTFRNGAPPMGLVVGTDGFLTGTPNMGSGGTYNFGVCVTDSVSAEDCNQTSVVISPQENLTTETTTVPQGSYSTWTAHITGVRTSRYMYYCDQGSVNVDYTLTFTAPPEFLAALQNHDSYGFSTQFDHTPTSHVSGTETPTSQCEGDPGYTPAVLYGYSVNFDSNITGGINNSYFGGVGYLNFDGGGFSLNGDNFTGGYYQMYGYFRNRFGDMDYECLNPITVVISSYSPTQITGNTTLQGCGYGDTNNMNVVFTRTS